MARCRVRGTMTVCGERRRSEHGGRMENPCVPRGMNLPLRTPNSEGLNAGKAGTRMDTETSVARQYGAWADSYDSDKAELIRRVLAFR